MCVLDAKIPLTFETSLAGSGLADALDSFSDKLRPIIQINTDDLCNATNFPSISADLDFE